MSASGLTGKTWRIENLNFVDDGDGDSIKLTNGGTLTVSNCTFDGADLFLSGHRAIQAEPAGPNNQLTVENSTFQNGWYVSVGGHYTSLNVKDSTFTNVKSGINAQVAANTVTIDNTDFSVIAQAVGSDTYGVRFASSSPSGKDLTITNSSFVVDKNDLVAEEGTYHSAIIVRAGATGTLKVENSRILGEVVNQATLDLDASPNWWGSIKGPQAGQITDSVISDPWCGDADCSFVVSYSPPGEEGGFYFDEDDQLVVTGEVSVPDGIEIKEPGLTVVLKNGAVIQNESPCFVINASYTQILAEPGAKCIPTEGSNGIDVAADLTDIRVKGLEIDGTGQSTGDGIHFDGVVNGTVLVDNKIHYLGGDGIEFVESPTGTVDIHGNLFAFNNGVGINNSDTTSPTVVAAEYNSWGSYYGPTGEGGDGVSANVAYNPYTYGDFWMSSSGSPWADQVVKGQSITYTIKALVKEVNAADVTFTYPEGLTVTASQAIVTKFESGTVTHNAGTRTFTYVGMSNNGNENETVDLFSVTFTANQTMRNVPMDIVTGSFGMAGVGSSSNVYVQGIDDGSITVIDLPTLASDDIDGPYLAGVAKDFHVTVNNPATGGNFVDSIYYVFTIAGAEPEDIFSLTCNDIPVTLTDSGTDLIGRVGYGTAGFPMPAGQEWTTTCNVKFKSAGSYSFTVDMVDNTSGNPDADILLTTLTDTAVVNSNFAITGTFSMQGNLNRGGIPVTLTWTGTGWTYAASDTTEDLLVDNFQVTVTYGGDYTITTLQPRYLNVYADVSFSKIITVADDYPLPALQLRGGNAVWTNNEIDLEDASKVGADWGSVLNPDGNVNFDSIVNIQDLALVGGNYGLTSADAYGTWLQ